MCIRDRVIFSLVGGWLGWFLGGCDGLLYALIAFVVLDYVTGLMCAVSDKTLSSEVGFKGICRKAVSYTHLSICLLWKASPRCLTGNRNAKY